MRILHISHLYHPSIGGNQIHLKKLSEHLTRKGEDVTVFTAKALTINQLRNPNGQINSLLSYETLNGVKIRRFPPSKRIQQFVFKHLPKIRGGYRLSRAILKDWFAMMQRGGVVPQSIQAILAHKPDVVCNINSCNASTIWAYLAHRIRKFPYVIIPCLHIHDQWVKNPFIYTALQDCDCVVALTEFEKNFLIQKGIDPHKIRVISPAIDFSDFPVPPTNDFRSIYGLKKDPVILYMGRLSKEKGIDGLIQAFALVCEKIPKARLILAGSLSENYKKALKNKIKTLKSKDRERVLIINHFSESQKNEICHASDCLVLPSVSESFGIVLLEAWACQKPVITTRNSAPGSVVDENKDGLLYAYENDHELADQITTLLKNKRMRTRLGRCGYQKVLEKFTWPQVADQFQRLYRTLIRNHLIKERMPHGTLSRHRGSRVHRLQYH